MKIRWLSLFFPLVLAPAAVPTFQRTINGTVYTLVGREPALGASTTIPTTLVALSLSFDASKPAGKPLVLDAAPNVQRILRSPVFTAAAFPSGGTTQYADAMLRTTFAKSDNWHTLLGKPDIQSVKITIPIGYGYVLAPQSGGTLAVVDLEFLQRELFKQLPKKQDGLILAITRNTTYYALGDATVCCSWGTHGVDKATGNSFVLASYLDLTPAVVTDRDVQPITQQLAQFMKDPLRDPFIYTRNTPFPGNAFPAWMRLAAASPADQGLCGGPSAGSTYFLLEPTNTNLKNNIPASPAFVIRANGSTWHLQNTALLSWYLGPSEGIANTLSFPDAAALTARSQPCPTRTASAVPRPTATPAPRPSTSNRHQLIGYWAGYGGRGSTFPLREVSPQWDVVIVAFATPDRTAPEGTLQFRTPAGLDTAQFKADIAYLKSQGRKVMISLGGGGQHFTLADPKRVPNFVSSVTRIVTEYGFDGIDIDFESPSLSIDPGDTDFEHPVTPSIVNLISALRQLRDHFGDRFMISLVPEGTQIPSGLPSYGGQFGSYLPITHALRDILSFIDVQSYNTPPLLGLDGEIYQPGSVDYHVAMTELLLHGFNVGGDPKRFFAALPADKVAVGFLTGDTNPTIVSQAMDFLITGKAPAGCRYKLREPRGYPGMIGAMFWTIDADRRANYNFSNVVGPQLHAYPAANR